MDITNHQARYFAYELTRKGTQGLERLSMSLFDAAVDLNPHQIEAALFAIQSPLSKGVILCDEVGLGKTIEAGIVLCQFWAEKRRRLLVICPASIRKQWALELKEKFNLPIFVLDAKSHRESIRHDKHPLDRREIVIASYHYINRIKDEVKAIPWDLVVIDEAHKLRNAYRESNKIGQGIRWATEGCRKLLLTATPLQNSLLELYGLSTLIDEHIFGDIRAFRSQFMGSGGNLPLLKERVKDFTKRTLRKDVLEYISYTERRPITIPFSPTDAEQRLYNRVSEFINRMDTYSFPKSQRHLLQLIVRKLLASSSSALAGTLRKLKERLEALREEFVEADISNGLAIAEDIIDSEEMEGDLIEEIFESVEEENGDETKREEQNRIRINEEIRLLDSLIHEAEKITIDTKSESLLTALSTGFDELELIGAKRKALIFTESRRTQEYLKSFLEENGYRGQVVLFNGTNSGPEATAIYEDWLEGIPTF